MTKFVIASKLPEELPKGSHVITYPDFMQEIQENKSREGRGGFTGLNHMRSVVGSIGAKYDERLTAYTVRPHLFEGRAYANDKEFSNILLEMLETQYMDVFEKYLDYQLKNRPSSTKVVYYVGKPINPAPFFTNGMDALTEKEAHKEFGTKPSKKVSKESNELIELSDDAE